METSTNQEFFWHGLTGCVLVLVRQCRVSFGGVVVSGKLPGRGLCGLCLAHCWVLRQQDLFAAMHLGHLLVFLLFLLPVSPVTVSSSAPFMGVWVVVSGGLVDGVVV